MTILDRYLLRHFFQIFLICLLSLIGLYVVIDAFGHLEEFSEQVDENGSLLGVIGSYYSYQSLDLFDRTSGILAMMAAMFTITWLQRHNEFTALMAAGISKFRTVRPLLFAAIALSLLSALNRELVLPQLRDELTQGISSSSGSDYREIEALYDSRTDVLIGGEKVSLGERRIVKPTFILPESLSQYGQQLVAEDAYYKEATEDRPSGYLLEEVSVPANMDRYPSLRLDEQLVVVTARDAPWLEIREVFVVSQLSFEMLANGSAWRRYASLSELIQELNHPTTELNADIRVAVHKRLVQPITDCTMLLLGLPLMLARGSRNVFLSVGICLAAAVSFSLVLLVCQSLGGLGLLRPSLAAWLPLMLFVPIAVGASHSFRT